jgi:AcrR family transcriptional regulator
MSWNRSFRSKDGLIAACLEERDEAYWQWFDGVLAQSPDDPREQLRGAAKRTSKPGYRGCFFSEPRDRLRGRFASRPDVGSASQGDARFAALEDLPATGCA